MANARALDKRRKSVRNVRKITRTMELIATARFKKAMDRAMAATSYTHRITKVVRSLANAGLEVTHPLLEERTAKGKAVVLVLTPNRGLCGGYIGGVLRAAVPHIATLRQEYDKIQLEVSGKRGIGAMKFRGIQADETFLQFDDQPRFHEVDEIATRYLDAYMLGEIDRVDVVYTKFVTISRQIPTLETLLPLGGLADEDDAKGDPKSSEKAGGDSDLGYEFFPSAESILEEVVPTSFKVKLFKCFLDAAVSEQIARMIAMKSATENAGDMIRSLSRTFNRARQSQITNEIMEVIGGAEALNG
jgi:F-type H+-transporting ATPase subunit gamma